MPTNIVQAQANPVGQSGWSTVGQGAQGLAQLVGGLMSAQAANKAKGQATLDAAGYKNPGMQDLQINNGGIAANPFAGGAGSGDLGTATLLSSRPVDGMVQPFSSAPRGEYLNVGLSSQPSDLMKSLQFSSPGGIAQSPFQTMMTRNFLASTFQPFQYGGL